MKQSPTVAFLHILGSFWFAIVLVVVIMSAGFEGPRDFIASLNIFQHLGISVVLLVPGVIVLYVAERMRSPSG